MTYWSDGNVLAAFRNNWGVLLVNCSLSMEVNDLPPVLLAPSLLGIPLLLFFLYAPCALTEACRRPKASTFANCAQFEATPVTVGLPMPTQLAAAASNGRCIVRNRIVACDSPSVVEMPQIKIAQSSPSNDQSEFSAESARPLPIAPIDKKCGQLILSTSSTTNSQPTFHRKEQVLQIRQDAALNYIHVFPLPGHRTIWLLRPNVRR